MQPTGVRQFATLFFLLAIVVGCSPSDDAKPAGSTGPASNANVPPPPPPASPDSASNSTDNAPATPEAVVAAFLRAVLKCDQAAAESYMIPNPDADMLWTVFPKTRGLSDQQRNVMETMLEQALANLKRLQPGDNIQIGFAGTRAIKPEEINENRVLILEPASSNVYILMRSNGTWKIDVSIVIENDKAKQTPPPDATGTGGGAAF
jgi:hypothetical protein